MVLHGYSDTLSDETLDNTFFFKEIAQFSIKKSCE